MAALSSKPSPEVGHDLVNHLSSPDTYSVDIEQKVVDEAHLLNTTVNNFLWKDITVTVTDHKTKKPKAILENVSGFVNAGKQWLFDHAQSSLVLKQ